MTSTTDDQQLVLPVNTDLNDVPTHMASYNSGVESRLVKRYLSATDRSVRNPAPQEGEISYLRDINAYEFHDGSGWGALVSTAAWQTYTPTWGSTTGTQPTVGNGTVSGRYQKVGKTVHLWVRILVGSTTTFGSAQWTLSLPVPSLASGIVQMLPGRSFDVSSPNAWLAVGHLTTGGTITLETQGTVDTDVMSATQPFTWANGDFVVLQGTYEAA